MMIVDVLSIVEARLFACKVIEFTVALANGGGGSDERLTVQFWSREV